MDSTAEMIRTKAMMFQLHIAGVLGNRLRTWPTVQEALDTDVHWFGLRELNAKGGGGRWVKCDRAALPCIAEHWRRAGRTFNVGEAAPDDLCTFHGEIRHGDRGWEGTAAVHPKCPMRLSTLRPMGAAVRLYARQFMDASSLEDLDAVFERYPDAVVEFSTYAINVGIWPNRNTIIWEVRNY